jgi:hypothetical protein
VGGAISAPFSTNMYIPQLVFFWGGQIYFLARRVGFPMTSVVIIHVFFFAFIVRESCWFCGHDAFAVGAPKINIEPDPTSIESRRRKSTKGERISREFSCFRPPFFIIIIVVFLACRRVVVVDPISLCIPLKQNQFDMPSLSRGGMKGWYWKFLPIIISIEVAPLGVWLWTRIFF